MQNASAAPVGDIADLGKHLLKIAAFIGIAVLAYSPMGGHGIHVPAAPMTREEWAVVNYTADAWAIDNWDWGGEQQLRPACVCRLYHAPSLAPSCATPCVCTQWWTAFTLRW